MFWSSLPPYACACLRALAEQFGAELLVFRYPRDSYAAFGQRSRWLHVPVDTIDRSRPADVEWRRVRRRLEAFGPEVALVSGWSTRVFNLAATYLSGHRVAVVSMVDNQWRATVRQRLGCIWGRLAFPSRFSALWVTGKRGEPLARRLGYTGDRLLTGVYSADVGLFRTAVDARRSHAAEGWPRAFLFVGRLVETKGVRELINAYQVYRSQAPTPWRLQLAGMGPLASCAEGEKGVQLLGFLGPEDLALAMGEAGCLVLPSIYEPWGVVVHEAAAAGLPIICSRACGASDYLVEEDRNGYLFSPGQTSMLAELMLLVSTKTDLPAFGAHSVRLAEQFSPAKWADTLVSYARRALSGRPSGAREGRAPC